MSKTPAAQAEVALATPVFYPPGRSYDEMLTQDGEVRPHYAALQSRM